MRRGKATSGLAQVRSAAAGAWISPIRAAAWPLLVVAVLVVGLGPGGAFDRLGAERELVMLTNADRTSNGLASLRLDNTLTGVARGRSEDMATRNYFGHEIPPGGRFFEDLLDSAGIRFLLAGENLARNNHPDAETTRRAHVGFLNSPSHRANIMEPAYREVGAGVWYRPDEMKYYTVLFMQAAGETAQVPSGTAPIAASHLAASRPPGWHAARHRVEALLGRARITRAQEMPADQSGVPADAASGRSVRRGTPEPVPPTVAPPTTTEVVAAQPAYLGLLDAIITRVLKLYLSV